MNSQLLRIFFASAALNVAIFIIFGVKVFTLNTSSAMNIHFMVRYV